jgi:hypothetical protein
MPKRDSGIGKQREYEVAWRLHAEMYCALALFKEKKCNEQLLERDQQPYGMVHVM